MIKENIFLNVLTSRNSPDHIFKHAEKQGLSREEVEKLLREDKILDFYKRELMLWRMHHLVEEIVLQHPTHSNGDLTEILVLKWNEKENVKITKSDCKQFIESMYLQLDNRKRAFISLCNNDIQSCLVYLRKDSFPMVEWLLRLGLLVGKRELDIIDIAKVIVKKHFPHVSEKDEIFDAFRKLNFTMKTEKKRTKFDFERIKNYKKAFLLNDLSFSRGLSSFILDEIQSYNTEPFIHFKTVLQSFLDSELRASNTEKEEEQTLNFQSDKQEINLDNTEDQNDTISEIFEEVQGKANLKPAVTMDGNKDMDLLSAVESLKEKAVKHLDLVNSYKVKIEELEKENLRLSRQVEIYEQSKVETSYEKFTSFIKSLGGREGNFALHELFKESNGDSHQDPLQTQGRLITLFSSMQLMGVEPYLANYQLDEIVTLNKMDIGNKFTVKSMIQSSTEDVQVKIVGYGWTLNGKILVQPIVEQVK
ncbi:hypothetical protein [Priestia megaterium]|uniref:hypothetical protein n=1 Tax=Priestia megaterium TaxID=1404 RepID=UPI003242FFEE